MAVNPKQMEAWLRPDDEEEDLDEEMPAEGGEEMPADEAGEEMPEDGDVDSPEEAAAEGDLESRYPTLFQLLEDQGLEVEDAADVLDGEMLTNPDAVFEGEERDMLLQAAEALPDDVREALKSEAAELTWDDAISIADALEAGEHITDPERFAGLIFHVRQVLV